LNEYTLYLPVGLTGLTQKGQFIFLETLLSFFAATLLVSFLSFFLHNF